MSISPNDRNVIESYARAMSAGPAGLEELTGLFAQDAVYIEPWTMMGIPTEHIGAADIRTFFEESLPKNPPDFKVTIDQIDLDGEAIRTAWTCTSAMIPAPVRGIDLYTIRDGRIARLETQFDFAGADTSAWSAQA